jgi:hypothetical protein
MTTSVAPQRVFSNKSTLIGIAVPTPTRKDGTPIPLADTPPQGFQKVRVPRSDSPPAIETEREAARAQPPAPMLTQEAIDAVKAAANSADPQKVDASTRVTRRDLPVHGAARASIPVSNPATTSDPAPAGNATSSSRWLLIGVAVAALVLGGRWFLLQKQAPEAESPPPSGVQVVPPVAEKAPPQADPPPASATPDAPSTAPPPAPGTEGTEAAAPAASDSAAPVASAAPPEGTRVVIVTISPPQARLFRKGKPVGSSPVRIELGPDEKRRSFEVGAPGWRTRRLVVDGTKPEIFIGLKPEPSGR